MIRRILCWLGFHRYNNEFVGLLYRQCERCKKNIGVVTENSYRPNGK